ncbi:hypothetical protein D3C87_1829090 [compost metagenome]
MLLDGLGSDDAGLFAQCSQRRAHNQQADDDADPGQQRRHGFAPFDGATQNIGQRPCLPD